MSGVVDGVLATDDSGVFFKVVVVVVDGSVSVVVTGRSVVVVGGTVESVEVGSEGAVVVAAVSVVVGGMVVVDAGEVVDGVVVVVDVVTLVDVVEVVVVSGNRSPPGQNRNKARSTDTPNSRGVTSPTQRLSTLRGSHRRRRSTPPLTLSTC